MGIFNPHDVFFSWAKLYVCDLCGFRQSAMLTEEKYWKGKCGLKSSLYDQCWHLRQTLTCIIIHVPMINTLLCSAMFSSGKKNMSMENDNENLCRRQQLQMSLSLQNCSSCIWNLSCQQKKHFHHKVISFCVTSKIFLNGI